MHPRRVLSASLSAKVSSLSLRLDQRRERAIKRTSTQQLDVTSKEPWSTAKGHIKPHEAWHRRHGEKCDQPKLQIKMHQTPELADLWGWRKFEPQPKRSCPHVLPGIPFSHKPKELIADGWLEENNRLDGKGQTPSDLERGRPGTLPQTNMEAPRRPLYMEQSIPKGLWELPC